jgi:predicted nucleic acid-binding protein
LRAGLQKKGRPIEPYDALLTGCALAQRLQTEFVTGDRRRLKAFPRIARTMQAFIAN